MIVNQDTRYKKRRELFKKHFKTCPDISEAVNILSPDKKYLLSINLVGLPNQKNPVYSKAQIYELENLNLIHTVLRNTPFFWFTWTPQHLLFGEEQYGLNVFNLETRSNLIWFPESGYNNTGVYWLQCALSTDKQKLAVLDSDYFVNILDFTEPTKLMYPTLSKFKFEYKDFLGWENNYLKVDQDKYIDEHGNEVTGIIIADQESTDPG